MYFLAYWEVQVLDGRQGTGLVVVFAGLWTKQLTWVLGWVQFVFLLGKARHSHNLPVPLLASVYKWLVTCSSTWLSLWWINIQSLWEMPRLFHQSSIVLWSVIKCLWIFEPITLHFIVQADKISYLNFALYFSFLLCVVPENIHAPPMEGFLA